MVHKNAPLLKLGLVCMMLTGFLVSHAQFLNWQFENIVTDLRQSGAYPDMLIDGAGNMHISYWDKNRDLMMYAKKNAGSGVWSHEAVDPTRPAGYRSALTIDDGGDVHIAYYENINETAYLRYVTNASGAWVSEAVFADSALGMYGFDPGFTSYVQLSLDIEIEADGLPLISYFDGTIFESRVCISQLRPFGFDFDLHLAKQNANGKWEGLKYVRPISTVPNCVAISRGEDRFGEFSKLIIKEDSTYLIVTNSLHNHEMLLFRSDSTGLSSWQVTAIDSAGRVMPSNLVPRYEEGFAFSDAKLTNDRYLHITYAFCESYGLTSTVGFGRPELRNVIYTQIDLDSLDEPGYQIFHHEFLVVPTDDHFRTYLSLDARGKDSVFLAYYDSNEGEVRMAKTINGGRIWSDFQMFDSFNANSFLKLQVYLDSVYTLAYNSREDQSYLVTNNLAVSARHSTFATRTERRATYLASSIERAGGDDRIHIAIDEKNEDRLYYGLRSSGNWDFEPVDTAGGGISFVGLQLDVDGNPFIAYLFENENSLRMAYRDNGNWQTEVINNGGTPDEFSFVLRADSAHICYYDRSVKSLVHSSSFLKSGNWLHTLVDSSNRSTGRSPSLQADQAGHLHVAYRDNDRRLIRYAYRNASGSWISEDATDSSEYNPLNISLQLTQADSRPVIGFRDVENNALLLTEKIAGSWQIDSIISSQSNLLGSPLQLLLDHNDNRWLLYNYVSAQEEMRLLRRTAGGTIWHPVSVINNDAQIAGTFNFHQAEDDFYIIGRKNKLGDQGIGLLYAPEGVTTELDFIQGPLAGLKIYPNPSRESSTIAFFLEESQMVGLELIDLQGRVIFRQEEKLFIPGNHEWVIHFPETAPGIYLVRVKVGSQSFVKKLAILKN